MTKEWKIDLYANVAHVTPIGDVFYHTKKIIWNPQTLTPSSICGCKPRREYVLEKDRWVFVHDAFDGRLGVEWANKILEK